MTAHPNNNRGSVCNRLQQNDAQLYKLIIMTQSVTVHKGQETSVGAGYNHSSKCCDYKIYSEMVTQGRRCGVLAESVIIREDLIRA